MSTQNETPHQYQEADAREMSRFAFWRDISYLQRGTTRQQQAYACLTQLDILNTLAAYNPVLVGTIPIDLALPTSDLDIVCEVHNLDTFEQVLRTNYGREQAFRLRRNQRWGKAILVCDFEYGGFPIQVYGTATPVTQQRGYRHMLAEAHLLAVGGNPAKTAILALKASGLKTEPAFASYFNLSGDPYEALLLDTDWAALTSQNTQP